MKLLTHMRKWSDGKTWPTVEGGRYVCAPLEHDAMAAHALLQAMESVHKDYPRVSASIGMPLVQKRADAILSEWTKQDEVAK